NVVWGSYAGFRGAVVARMAFLPECLVPDEFSHRAAEVCRHFFNHGIAFGMNCAFIQGLGAAADPQKSGALFKRLVSKQGYLFKLVSRLERTVFLPVFYDVRGQFRPETRYIVK